MSLATLAPPPVVTMADLLDRSAISRSSGSGKACTGNGHRRRRHRHPCQGETVLCELVDGVLVEKPMGYEESRLAIELGFILVGFLRGHDLGTVAGEAGMMQLMPGLVRIPDVSFVLWEHLPERYGPIPPMAPDLAVEVLSESNTPAEMERKLREYFAAGTQLVWYFDLKTRTVTVYTAPDRSTVLGESETLDGGNVLPGLAIPLRELFERASRRRGPGA